MIKQRVCCFLLWITTTLTVNSQIYETAIPFSVSEKLPAITSFAEMESVDIAFCLQKATARQDSKKIKSLQFAKALPVNLNPHNSGEWEETNRGWAWRIGIQSKGALSLYLNCDSFFFADNIKLFVYSPDYTQFKGAFTSRNNNPNNTLSIAPTPGDSVILEINVPNGINNYGIFNISKVYHDYTGIFGKKKASALKSLTNPCEENVNCENGQYWQTEKRAVCRIIEDGQLSTGTLIGNTSGSKEAYIITANHATFDSTHAADAIFYFNYEVSPCNSYNLNEDNTLSGGTLVATSNRLDFSLIKLNSTPPISYRTFYAGWDRRNVTPESGICLHHPWGRETQIAIEYHPLLAASYSNDYDLLSFWNVRHWEIGTTENGSSGSALFNQDHRLIGTLTGGSASCYYTSDDYFSNLSLAWDKYSSPDSQLKKWLDPQGKSPEFIDGYDPYGFNLNACDTAWNIQNNESWKLSKYGLNWGWLTGQNAMTISQFAEKFQTNSSIQLPGIFLNVAKNYYTQPLSHIIVKVWKGDALPSNEIYTQIVFLKDLVASTVNYINFDSIVKTTGSFFVGYEVNYQNPADTFAVFHTINPVHSVNSSMYVYNGMWQNINKISSLNTSATLGVGITQCYGSILKSTVDAVRIYPNPCYDHFSIELPAEMNLYGVDCFDLTGRKMPVTLSYTEKEKVVHFNLPAGTYILKINTNTAQLLTKFVVLKNN